MSSMVTLRGVFTVYLVIIVDSFDFWNGVDIFNKANNYFRQLQRCQTGNKQKTGPRNMTSYIFRITQGSHILQWWSMSWTERNQAREFQFSAIYSAYLCALYFLCTVFLCEVWSVVACILAYPSIALYNLICG